MPRELQTSAAVERRRLTLNLYTIDDTCALQGACVSLGRSGFRGTSWFGGLRFRGLVFRVRGFRKSSWLFRDSGSGRTYMGL